MAVCTVCQTESELIREKHSFGSDGICEDCGCEAPEETEGETTEETEADTSLEGEGSGSNGSDTTFEFNPLLLIPAAALAGIIAIVIVLIARRKRR